MEHLALEVFDREGTGSQFASLPEDASITITATSEIFAKGDVWSHAFSLNAAANAHIVGTAGEIHGSRLHDILHKRRARLWVEGLPLFLGYLVLDDEVEVDGDGNFDLTFESGQHTFDEMIEGAKANQVPMMGDVMIGLALWRKRKVSVSVRLKASFVFDYQETEDLTSEPSDVFYQTEPHDGTRGRDVPFTSDGEKELQAVQEYPRMVFPRLETGTFTDLTGEGLTEFDCINTDSPYDDSHPYCNVALCYQKQGYEKKQTDGTYIPKYNEEPEAQRGYEYMPANRLNSAPNFYVIYWLRALMKHLGIYIEENQMMDVEDLKRLFFVNTNCAYKEPTTLRTAISDPSLGKYRFNMNGRQISRLVPEYFGRREEVSEVAGRKIYEYKRGENINKEESGFVCTDYRLGQALPSGMPAVKHIKIDIESAGQWSETDREQYEHDNGYLHRAYATPECFPNVDISEVIHALESGFGIRLLFSDDYKRVRIVLLRNLFRDTAVQHINCEVVRPEEKVENSIRGFRMTYGDKDDTHFHYKGFDDMLPHKKELWQDNSDTHDYSKWKLDANYADIIKRVNAFDKTCYVTPATGNAYGIKIDKDAKRYDELYPSLFGYGEYMDAEDGDCTGEEETIETVNVGFMPAIMNDLNMENERKGETEQLFALFVDETMRPRRPSLKGDGTDYDDPATEYPIYGSGGLYDESKEAPASSMKVDGIVKPGEFAVRSDMYAQKDDYRLSADLKVMLVSTIGLTTLPVTMNIDGHINEGYRLYLQDNYEPNDNGVSPVESHDWGLTLGIMRGSGDDAYVRYEGDPDDGEGNDTWRLMPGSSVTAHPDTCDNYGKLWDYNGKQSGTSGSDIINTRELAINKLSEIFPGSNAAFNGTGGYISGASVITIPDNNKTLHNILIATYRSMSGIIDFGPYYIPSWILHSVEDIMRMDAYGQKIIIEMDSSWERCDTLLQLCQMAYGNSGESMTIDNGVDSRYGRFSLKLRAEKPNPYFDPTQEESSYNRRYLAITNENLKGRGLADQFYKEYSYWIRNSRIVKRTVRMTLAQLLTIDKTKRSEVGDVTGFIRKMQYTISNKTGLGDVTMEIMYI